MLVDTDVLIWYLRGHQGAAQFLDGLAELALSATYMELGVCRTSGHFG